MTRETLDAIGRRYGAPQASSDRDYLATYEEALARLEPAPTLIVLALGEGGTATAATFARRFPQATVHLLLHDPARPDHVTDVGSDGVEVHPCQTSDDRRRVLIALPRVDLLVEGFAPTAHAKLIALRDLHGYVRAGGLYASEGIERRAGDDSPRDLGDCVRAVVDDAVARTSRRLPKRGWETWVDALAVSLGPVTVHRDLALLEKRQALTAMLRTSEAADILRARYGERSPLEQLDLRPGLTFESRATIASHGEGPTPVTGPVTVPDLAVRRYRDVVTYPRQLVRHEDFWLPETFRRQYEVKPTHHGLVKSGDDLAVIRPRWAPEAVRCWDGPLFYLDTEFPGHFGHVSTEVVSRLWGWDVAVRADPDVRPMISLRPGQDAVPSFVHALLEAYGIPGERLVVQSGRERLAAPVLYGVDQQFQNPKYAAPAMRETWERIRSGLGAVSSPVRAERLFVTRTGRRRPRQAKRIERFFTRRGFTVVRPELYPFAEQVALFAQARIIAGYGGSAMFTMAYAPHARVIVISGDDYRAQNEALIAAVNGNDVHYFWGRSLVTEQDPRKPKKVFEDDFDFDLRRHRRDLRAALR